MKKRLYALLLCLLVLTAFPLTALAAGEGSAPELTLSTRREGDALTVTVGIVNNPGIAGLDLALHFNSAALTPTAEPSMADGWAHSLTNYASPFSGDALRVVSVNAENVTGDGALFTATFTVTGSGGCGLFADGTACTEGEEYIELSGVYADAFGVSVERTAGGVTFTAASYGNGYHGEAKAILTRYRNGQFVGCVMKSITVAENGETDAMLAVSGGGQTEEWKLLLLDTVYRPIAEAKTL